MTYCIQSAKESGIIVWAEAPCGIKQPLVGWSNVEKMKRFAHGLLMYCDSHTPKLEPCPKEGKDDAGEKASVEKLLRQVFGESEQDSQIGN